MTDSTINRPVRRRRRKPAFVVRFASGTMRWVPFFILTILVYLLLEVSVDDIRAPFMKIGSFALSPVELLYAFAAIFSMLELLKVANPGSNDAGQVMLMVIATIINIVLFTIGAVLSWAGVENFFTIFTTSEFLVLIVFSAMQAAMANWINGVTAQRTIGTGTTTHDAGYADDDYGDHH